MPFVVRVLAVSLSYLSTHSITMNQPTHYKTKTFLTRELCVFALPMLLANILQSCYNIADMAMVGRFLGREALAAVSNTTMICFISNSICIGFCVGGNALVAKYRGARDVDAQRKTIRTLFALSLIGGIALTVLNYVLYTPLLRWMNTPSDALLYAKQYMSIICIGNVFVFGYNAVCSVMRGLGDSRRPLFFVAVSAVVNVVFDYIFLAFFHWGVYGVALATVLAQAAACMAAVESLRRQGQNVDNRAGKRVETAFVFQFDRHCLKMDKKLCGELLHLGLPTAFRSAALNLSYLVVTALFNNCGTAAAAAAGIGLKINTFVAMPSWALGMAVSIMAGHCMGAKNPDRAAKIARRGIAVGLIVNGAFLLLIHLWIRPFL